MNIIVGRIFYLNAMKIIYMWNLMIVMALTTLDKCVHLHKVLWYSNSRYVDNTRTFAFSNSLLREVDGTCCNKISGVLSDNCNETGGPCFIFYADVMHKMLTIIDLDIGSVKPFTNCHNASFSSYFTYQFEVAAVRYYCSFIADLLYKCLNGIGCCMMYCYCIYRADIMYKLLSIIDLQWLIFWCECSSYKLFWVTSIIIYLFSWLSWILMIMSSNFYCMIHFHAMYLDLGIAKLCVLCMCSNYLLSRIFY
jgi:hypothetical protein